MKKIFLLFAIVTGLGLETNLTAQESSIDDGFLNAFTAEKAEWTIDYTTSTTHECEDIRKVILEGDTIIDKINWKIIKDPHNGTGFIRVDKQKVIYKPDEEAKNNIYPYTGEEMVVYDFSLEVGDSILFHHSREPLYIKITEVDSVLLQDGKKHKRLICSSDRSYIEGIGSVMESPLFMFVEQVTGDNFMIRNNFICCHVDDQLLYRNPRYTDCEGSIVSNETIQTPDNLKISMNDNILNVKLDEEEPFDIAIYSLNGVLLKQQKGNSKEAIIPVYFGKGIFVIRITCGKDIYTRKVYNK